MIDRAFGHLEDAAWKSYSKPSIIVSIEFPSVILSLEIQNIFKMIIIMSLSYMLLNTD